MTEPLELPIRDEADAKAWFYLEHRGDIETWAALRSDAARLLERYLLALVSAVDELAEEFDATLYERDIESGAWPRFGLSRPSWQHDGLHDVAVAIEWDRSRLLKGTGYWPYVGVRVTPQQKDPARRQAITAAVSPARSMFTDRRSNTWPLWQYVRPAEGDGGSVDPAALTTQVWSRWRELWNLTAPAIDALHEARHV